MRRSALAFVLVFCSGIAGYVHPTAATAAESKVETGEINGAKFYLEIPAAWNKGLVMYCHGYDTPGSPPINWNAQPQKGVREVFLSRGFAFAASSFKTQGYAVKEGIEDTEGLRQYFIKKYGQPRETFVTGHSMGGHITVAIIEQYSKFYDGAMPLCGELVPAIDFLGEVFDFLVTFEYYFPGTIGSPTEIPADMSAIVAGMGKVRAAADAAPERAAMFARLRNISVKELPQIVIFAKIIVGELRQRAGGNPFDNRNTIYSGFDDDVAVNRNVKRYAPDPKAEDYVRRYYTPTGRINRPVLTVLTTYDPLIQAKWVNYYNVTTSIAGTKDLFVAKYVVANGHCNISSEKTASAFDQLLSWVHEHTRPAAGEVQ